jgi:nucleoid DNA-binding protein
MTKRKGTVNKETLAARVSDYLLFNGTKRHVHIPKKRLRVTDETGSSCNFYIKSADKELTYTRKDIEEIIDATITVILKEIGNGHPVSLYGFGVLEPYLRSARSYSVGGVKHDCDAYYAPRFTPGRDLKVAARLSGKKDKEVSDDVFDA